MDWNAERIGCVNEIEFYEHDCLRLRKKSNRFTAYTRCAFRSYKYGSYEYKKGIVAQVTGRRNLLPTNVDVRKLVYCSWQAMTNEMKAVWKRRGSYLNIQARQVGLVTQLPTVLSQEDNIVSCLQEERDALSEAMRSLTVTRVMSSTTKAFKMCMPHKVEVMSQVYDKMSMSALMRKTLFGTNFEKIREYENNSAQRCFRPGFLHFHSPTRLNEVFKLNDTKFGQHIDHRHNHTYQLTSLGVVHDTHGREEKVYGWDETNTHVTFVYHIGENTDQARYVTFPRPKFVTLEVTNNSESRTKRTARCYKMPEQVSVDSHGTSLTLVSFHPVCMKFHLKKPNYFTLLGARVCTFIDGNNKLIIVNNNSS